MVGEAVVLMLGYCGWVVVLLDLLGRVVVEELGGGKMGLGLMVVVLVAGLGWERRLGFRLGVLCWWWRSRWLLVSMRRSGGGWRCAVGLGLKPGRGMGLASGDGRWR